MLCTSVSFVFHPKFISRFASYQLTTNESLHSRRFYRVASIILEISTFSDMAPTCDVIFLCMRDNSLRHINDTNRKKLSFNQFSTRMAAWLLLIFFICLRNQLNSIHTVTHIKEYRCLKNVIHQICSKNECLLLSATFTAKFELVLVLTLENTFP